ncbi:MAG: hypothetical protein JWM68_635 [Verrucomicrobiales bacterium]|nr:hypothetical protein [Verrucomicrobiales bacterium]
MRTLKNTDWEGYASLACLFSLALIPLFTSMEAEFWNMAAKVVLFVSVFFGLLFGISGLRTGGTGARVCSSISLLLYAFAIYFVIYPTLRRH